MYSEKLPVYDDTAAEDYIRSIKEFFTILEDDERLKEDDNVKETSNFFRKMMKGEARATYTEKIDELPNGLTDIDALLEVLNNTSIEILGQDAFDNQIEYLKKTKKPKKLSVDEWLKRIRNINGALPYINMDEDKMSDKTLIRDLIMPNVPPSVKYDLRSFGGDELQWARVRSILTNIFTKLNVESNSRKNSNSGGRNGRNRFRNNNNGNGGNNSNNGKGGKNNDHNESYNTNKNKAKKKSNDDTEEDSDSSSSESEESRMMSRMERNEKGSKEKMSKRRSCAIIVSVKRKEGRKEFLALLDTGTTASLASRKAVKHCIKDKQDKTTDWTTQGGSFKTSARATVTDIVLPQFTRSRKAEFKMHLFEKRKEDTYDFILGCDFQQSIGIDVLSSKQKIAWDGIEVDMFEKNKKVKINEEETLLHARRNEETIMVVEPAPKIKDAEYVKPDLREVSMSVERLTAL